MRWVGLLVVLLFVAGCTTTVEGSGSAAEPSGVVLPPRPREVRIDGVDPCSLLTEQQRGELGLDGEPFFDSALSPLYNGAEVPGCAIRRFNGPRISVGVTIVPATGIELYTSGELAAEVRPTRIRDFPAVMAVPDRFEDFCTVIIDVAPQQLVDVQLADSGGDPVIPQAQLCREAETVADAVMTTLLFLR